MLTVRLPGMAEPVIVRIPSNSPGYHSIGVRLDGQRLTILVDCEVVDKITLTDELSSVDVNQQTVTIFSQPASVCYVARILQPHSQAFCFLVYIVTLYWCSSKHIILNIEFI